MNDTTILKYHFHLVKHRYTIDRVYLMDILLYHNWEIQRVANALNCFVYKIIAHNVRHRHACTIPDELNSKMVVYEANDN